MVHGGPLCPWSAVPMSGCFTPRLAQVALHVLVELVLQVHEEANLGFVSVLRRGGAGIAREPRNERVALNAGLLAEFL